jgi:hypothetical protein
MKANESLNRTVRIADRAQTSPHDTTHSSQQYLAKSALSRMPTLLHYRVQRDVARLW